MKHHKYIESWELDTTQPRTPLFKEIHTVVLRQHFSKFFESKCRYYFSKMDELLEVDLTNFFSTLIGKREVTLENMLDSDNIKIEFEVLLSGKSHMKRMIINGIKYVAPPPPMDPPSAMLLYLDTYYTNDTP